MNELQYSNNTDGDIEMEHTFELFSIVLILCCVGSGLCSSINNKVKHIIMFNVVYIMYFMCYTYFYIVNT